MDEKEYRQYLVHHYIAFSSMIVITNMSNFHNQKGKVCAL